MICYLAPDIQELSSWVACSGDYLGILSDVAAVYKTLGFETMVTIMSEEGKLSTHLLVALVLLAISLVFSSQDKLTDRQVIKKEIFIQKLAAKMDNQTGWVERKFWTHFFLNSFSARSKREIVSIHSPPLSPIPDPGEDQNQSSISGLAEQLQHCSLRSIIINFDMIGWTHILAPKEVGHANHWWFSSS